MTVVQLERENGSVRILDRGTDAGLYSSVHIHGCDTTIPARGRIKVFGVQSSWADEHGHLHLSDDKRAGPSESGGWL